MQRSNAAKSFRPFAPSVLREDVGFYFEQDVYSPFMMHVVKLRPEWRTALPAIAHVDGTGRLQSVDRDTQPAISQADLRSEKAHGHRYRSQYEFQRERADRRYARAGRCLLSQNGDGRLVCWPQRAPKGGLVHGASRRGVRSRASSSCFTVSRSSLGARSPAASALTQTISEPDRQGAALRLEYRASVTLPVVSGSTTRLASVDFAGLRRYCRRWCTSLSNRQDLGAVESPNGSAKLSRATRDLLQCRTS